MRKMLVVTTVAAFAGTAALAGGLGEPEMPKEEVKVRTASSAGGILIPLLILILVAVAASGGSDAAPALAP